MASYRCSSASTAGFRDEEAPGARALRGSPPSSAMQRRGFGDHRQTPADAWCARARAIRRRLHHLVHMLVTFAGASRCFGATSRKSGRPWTASASTGNVTPVMHGGNCSSTAAMPPWTVALTSVSNDRSTTSTDAGRAARHSWGLPSIGSSKSEDAAARGGIDSIRSNTAGQARQPRPARAAGEARRRAGVRRELQRVHRRQEWNRAHLIDKRSSALEDTMAELLSIKRRHRGVITNSDAYLGTDPAVDARRRHAQVPFGHPHHSH